MIKNLTKKILGKNAAQRRRNVFGGDLSTQKCG